MQQGAELADSASASLKSIEAGAQRNLDRVKEVADATREQSATSTSIAQRVEQIAQMVEETTATIRGTAATANELERIAISQKIRSASSKSDIGNFCIRTTRDVTQVRDNGSLSSRTAK